MTAEEVGVFTLKTTAYKLLFQLRRWLFVLQSNYMKNTVC